MAPRRRLFSRRSDEVIQTPEQLGEVVRRDGMDAFFPGADQETLDHETAEVNALIAAQTGVSAEAVDNSGQDSKMDPDSLVEVERDVSRGTWTLLREMHQAHMGTPYVEAVSPITRASDFFSTLSSKPNKKNSATEERDWGWEFKSPEVVVDITSPELAPNGKPGQFKAVLTRDFYFRGAPAHVRPQGVRGREGIIARYNGDRNPAFAPKIYDNFREVVAENIDTTLARIDEPDHRNIAGFLVNKTVRARLDRAHQQFDRAARLTLTSVEDRRESRELKIHANPNPKHRVVAYKGGMIAKSFEQEQTFADILNTLDHIHAAVSSEVEE